MDKEDIQEKLVETGRKIIKEQGAEFLTARKLSEASGCSVGTIYNQFGNMDNYILIQNYLTLEALYKKMTPVSSLPAYDRLNVLIQSFTEFILDNRQFWLMLFNFHLKQSTRTFSIPYLRHISKIIMMIEDAFRQMYPNLKYESRHISVQVLWITLFGLGALLTSDSINTYSKIAPTKISSFLLNTYLAGVKVLEKSVA